MKRVAIIQARMTSSRLPGKVLMDLGGQPLLARQLARLRRARMLDALAIATTKNASDDPLAALADREGVAVFRGDEHDVLSRYVGAMKLTNADVVVRITADCPLIDPEVVDRVVARLLDPTAPCDYASNTIQRSFPRGLDTEAMHADVLLRMARMASSQPAREHVTYFLHRERPELFVVAQVVDAEDNSDLRWTVDVPDDLAMMRALFAAGELGERHVGYADILRLVRARPDIAAMNRHVEQVRT